MLYVSEIFHSVQGEGPLRGTETVFLRTAGCNLRCTWCDTPYALERRQGTAMTPEGVVEKVRSFDCDHLVLTGGEPMIQQAALKPILEQLDGVFVEVETNGGFASEIDQWVDQYNCSPKLPCSGNPEYELKLLPNKKTWYKFVIDSDEDLEQTRSYIAQYGLPADRIQLMAQGATRTLQEEKADWTQKQAEQLNYSYTPRLHILNNYR